METAGEAPERMNQSITDVLSQALPAVESAGLFTSLCTLQQPDGTYVGSGQPSGTYSNVLGLVNLACMNAPLSSERITATEVRELEEIMSQSMRHVLLDGYFPQIEGGQTNGWRVIVDGDTFDLMGVESDSQRTMTRLHIRRVSI